MIRNNSPTLDDKTIVIFVLVISFIMPFATALLSHFVGNSPYTLSISAYYYSVARDIFVMALAVGAVLLISYSGRDTSECVTATVAGIMALLIALFPMDRAVALIELAIPPNPAPSETFVELLFPNFHPVVHNTSASIFFSLTAVLCFLFARQPDARRRSGGEPNLLNQVLAGATDGVSNARSRPYILCGLIVVFGLLSALINSLAGWGIYWTEVIMLFGFCLCWLFVLIIPPPPLT